MRVVVLVAASPADVSVRPDEPALAVHQAHLVEVVTPRAVHQVALVRRQGGVQDTPPDVLTLDGTDASPPAPRRVEQADVLV